jgi:hypothetical protein
MKRLIFLAIAVALIVAAPPATSTTYQCKEITGCQYEASCDGSHYTQSGCKIQCYNGGLNGQLTFAGSADCGSAKKPGTPLEPL